MCVCICITHIFFSIRCYKKIQMNFLANPIIYIGYPGGSVVKNLPINAEDVSLISDLGRYPGKGNGNPLQYSCLKNPMERGAWQARVYGGHKKLDILTEQQLYIYR